MHELTERKDELEMVGNIYKVSGSGMLDESKQGLILELCATRVPEQEIKDHFEFEIEFNEVEDEGIKYLEIYSDITGMDLEHTVLGYFLPCENDDLEKENKMLASIKKIVGPDSNIEKISIPGIM